MNFSISWTPSSTREEISRYISLRGICHWQTCTGGKRARQSGMFFLDQRNGSALAMFKSYISIFYSRFQVYIVQSKNASKEENEHWHFRVKQAR